MVVIEQKLPDSTNLLHLVREYEDVRKIKASSDISESKIFSIRLPVEDYAFFQAFSDFYGETRSTVVRDVLHASTFEILASLPVQIRNKIAQQADLIFLNEMKQLCKDSSGDFDMVGGAWVGWAQIFNECEDKKSAIAAPVTPPLSPTGGNNVEEL